MLHVFSDIRFTFRLIRRAPAFFATLLGVLIAGIGATTAMFSIVESLLLKPLPYDHPEELTMIWRTDPRIERGPTSLPDFLDFKAQATTFEQIAALDGNGVSLSSPGAKPESLAGAGVSGDFFPMFRIHALYGRFLTADDDRIAAPHVAVLSAALWHRRFGSDPNLIGKAITLNGEPHTVVGIAPEGFRFGGPYSDRTEVWTPLATTYVHYAEDIKHRGNHFLLLVGRRKAGVSIESAQAELTSITKNLQITYPDSNTKKSARGVDLHDALVGGASAGVWVLFAAVALVFIIVCANVANLLLTRAQSRRGEMAARAALGATPGRLTRQIVTETIVVFLLGAVGGSLLSRWLVDVFAKGLVTNSARTIVIHVDAVALLFSVVVCLVCGLVFGLIPALSVSRIEPQAVLKESASRAGISRSQMTIRSVLAVAQVALAFALLVGSGLAVKAFSRVAATPVGFDSTNAAAARIVLPELKYADPQKTVAFYRDLLGAITALPDVTAVGANSALPMAGSNSSGSFDIEGRAKWLPGDQPNLERNTVTPGYFKAMGIPLLRGRDFTDEDKSGGRLVMVISQAAAERFFPGEDPIGHRIDWGDLSDENGPTWREIVGVVGDVRRRGLADPIAVESYVPLVQHVETAMSLVVRSPRAAALVQELPAIVAGVDPEQAISSRGLMADWVTYSVGTQRYVALLLAAFAAFALILASLGIFGLVSYVTSQRTRELGIRMALGSTPEGVVALVMKGGLRLVAIGLGVGLLGAIFVGRVLASRVSGVTAFDLSVYLAIPAVLGVTGLVACLIPALRAVRIPPAVALRYE